MNLCIVTRSTTFHNKSGGLETQNKTLCEGLAKRGHKVTVLSTAYFFNKVRVENLLDKNTQYFFLNTPSGIYSKEWWKESAGMFEKLNDKRSFDVVISQSSAGKGIFGKNIEAKKIVINHGTSLGELKSRFKSLRSLRNIFRFFLKDIPSFFSWYMEDKQIFKSADRIVCVSNILAKNLIREYPSSKEKVVVIENGVDLSKFTVERKSQAVKRPTPFTLLYVGRVVEEKGIEDLLKALSVVRQDIENIALYIVGGGPNLDKFRALTKELKIEEVVNYVGELDNREVVKYYEKADIFVYPSLRQEGFPMVLAEAMASGLPIIASRIGGIPAAIDDKKTGILVEPGDVRDLASSIRNLYDNPQMRGEISLASKFKAQNCYSQEAMVEKYIKLFS